MDEWIPERDQKERCFRNNYEIKDIPAVWGFSSIRLSDGDDDESIVSAA